jgi:hypothetical protein
MEGINSIPLNNPVGLKSNLVGLDNMRIRRKQAYLDQKVVDDAKNGTLLSHAQGHYLLKSNLDKMPRP